MQKPDEIPQLSVSERSGVYHTHLIAGDAHSHVHLQQGNIHADAEVTGM